MSVNISDKGKNVGNPLRQKRTQKSVRFLGSFLAEQEGFEYEPCLKCL